MSIEFNGTSEIINNFYNLRLAHSRNGNENETATGWKAASWSSSGYQRRIFDVIMKNVKGSQTNYDSVLDVGCGVGDFLPYLFKNHYKRSGWTYTGIDISEDVIQEAKRQAESVWETLPHREGLELIPTSRISFGCGDFLDLEFEKSFEWVIAAGTFNLRLLDSPNQYAYLFSVLEKMFNLCDEGVIVTILSDRANQRSDGHKQFRFNDLFYYEPSKVLNHCLTHITENVVIDHSSLDYQFVLTLYPNDFEQRIIERDDNEKA
jgi:SAM-dependent methyltransferase